MSSADEAREMVDATGTRRRLQALLTNGYRAKDLVTSLGLHISCQRIIRSEKVSAVIRDSVAQLYRELEDQDQVGPSDLARERYRGLGYLPPMWWDSDIIDDPSAEPAGVRVYTKIRVEDGQGVSRYCRVLVDVVTETRAERVARMHRLGLSVDQIAVRIGTRARYVRRTLVELDVAHRRRSCPR
ncbi:hypothetical protein BS297_07325 [Rhodococcus erythropolis]|uniref:Uncharacterized protein n=1 Tax=Rhodococcus erythropolis TaxID=1833 RepID=A0A0C2VHR9_RHOER|nr:hypothetical protein BS297_07325 [Rhodococcus erythropolis]KIM14413.1 hypothetical protein QV65_32305 [Rhodococcus erythropolis]